MNKYYSIMLSVCFLLFMGCSTVTQDIKVDAELEPKASISGYKTYAWSASAQIVNDPAGQWEPPQLDADAEVRWLINRELRKRGIMEVAENPDLIVGFLAGIDMEAIKLEEDAETKMPIVKDIPQGALALIFIDASTGNPVWVGTANGEIQQQPSVEVVRKRLDYAVSEMFKLLPR